MQDPWNPTPEEICDWAFDASAPCPVEDWDLALADLQYQDILLSLAADSDCPKRKFFIAVLYLMVGDAVRSRWRSHGQREIGALLEKASYTNQADVLRWVQRSQQLIAEPSQFNYHLWCMGGYTREDIS